MCSETLHEILHAAPFQPFVLCLADGTKVNVPHPDFIAHPRGARIAVVMGRDESTHYIDVALVTKIEVEPPAPAGTIAQNPNGGE
ncbi:MAG TPA: hypothetical protein VKF17_20340 [Isosphaeraceae bacterium]|nr:hypothetical protein [Isosphaeraceae bacterium]